MTVFGTEIRYGLVAQALHWVTASLVFSTWLIAGTWRGGNGSLLALHQTLGFAVFVVVLVRLAWRQFDRRPKPPPRLALPCSSSFLSVWYGASAAVPQCSAWATRP